MERVRRKDTAPELAVRRRLHAAGFRYGLHSNDLPGRPDVVFRPLRIALFVHGCFWHGHQCVHGAVKSKSNSDYWDRKIETNRARDKRKNEELRRIGWRVIEVWECEVNSDTWFPGVEYALRAARRLSAPIHRTKRGA